MDIEWKRKVLDAWIAPSKHPVPRMEAEGRVRWMCVLECGHSMPRWKKTQPNEIICYACKGNYPHCSEKASNAITSFGQEAAT
jgi:hypothetical protein